MNDTACENTGTGNVREELCGSASEECSRFAKELYTTYCAEVGGIAFNGDTLPTWEEFSADPMKVKQYKAWLMVAVRANELCNSCK